MTAQVICLVHDWTKHPSGYRYCRTCGAEGYLVPLFDDEDDGSAS